MKEDIYSLIRSCIVIHDLIIPREIALSSENYKSRLGLFIRFSYSGLKLAGFIQCKDSFWKEFELFRTRGQLKRRRPVFPTGQRKRRMKFNYIYSNRTTNYVQYNAGANLSLIPQVWRLAPYVMERQCLLRSVGILSRCKCLCYTYKYIQYIAFNR